MSFESLATLADEAVIEHLTQVKGIGVWTAQMFLMFALRRKNVLPTGDLGVRTAIRKAYGLEELPKPDQIEELARGWHPYCTVASWYLWRSLEGKASAGTCASVSPFGPHNLSRPRRAFNAQAKLWPGTVISANAGDMRERVPLRTSQPDAPASRVQCSGEALARHRHQRERRGHAQFPLWT